MKITSEMIEDLPIPLQTSYPRLVRYDGRIILQYRALFGVELHPAPGKKYSFFHKDSPEPFYGSIIIRSTMLGADNG